MPKDSQQVTRDEHATISNVDGKKVFVIDDSANQITDFVNPTANVTIEQGTTPWVLKSGATITSHLYGCTNDGTWQKVLTYENQFVTLDHHHHFIHHSKTFTVTTVADLAEGVNHELIFDVPVTGEFIFHYAYDSEAETTGKIYEGVATENDGIAMTPYNRNRSGATPATMNITHTPSTASGGTMIVHTRSGSGKKQGGSAEGLDVLVLKNNTKYLFQLNAVAAGWVASAIDWHEEL